MDLGVRKPNPLCYSESASRMGISPSQILFISHELDELEGTLETGMGALALVGGRSDFSSETDPALAELALRYPGKVLTYSDFSQIPSFFGNYSK